MKNQSGISIITLGCAKNIVDSEYLAKQLNVNGFSVHHNYSPQSDIIVINTCGFINDAKEESVETILNYVEAKKKGTISKLFVVGCLSQRYKEQLKEEIKEVDGFFGVEYLKDLLKCLNAGYDHKYEFSRYLSTPDYSAYLKIAEGCNRKCSFCAIPFIRGKYRSETIENLYNESILLSELGVRELNLIAQDLSYYGVDLYGKESLGNLLNNLTKVDKIHWIRLLYLYPANFPYDILDIMRDNSSICNYLDIPLQHINDKVLRNMRRGIDRKSIYNLIELINSKIPDITLRTTFMVGYPGETEKEFNELKEFIREVKFDRMGVFIYSEEEGTFSEENFKDSIPQKIKQERADELMSLQQDISLKLNQAKIGKSFEVLIEREDAEFYYGRTKADAPEVDNEIWIPKNNNNLEKGKFYTTEVINASEYDLIGKIL
ncbi:MAG: 30S ribosomal protein S12 methylthiotransferase RimO [Bacteroidales bacterium]